MQLKYSTLFFYLTLIVILSTSCIWQEKIKIEQDEAGLIYAKYSEGLVMDSILAKGSYRNPIWNDVIILNVGERHKEMEFTFDLIDNSTVVISYKFGYKPIVDSVAYLYKQYRDEYFAKLITPKSYKFVEDILSDCNQHKLQEINLSSELNRAINSSVLTNYFENISISNLKIDNRKD